MRVLWVSTAPIGPAGRILNITPNATSGGWIQSEYDELLKENKKIDMFFLCGSREITPGEIRKSQTKEGTAYCINLPKISFGIKPSKKILSNIKQIVEEIKPDVIHIWGTESCISYAVSMLFPEIKKVLFIQGLLGMHMRYRGGYLDVKDNKYNKGAPFRSRIITDLRTFFYNKQVEYEKDTITNCNNVIIDNEFSEAYCTSISPNVVCYKKFLSADNVFFNEKWNFDRCEPNSIFTVYGFSADKGLHQLLKAMVIVKRSFPNVKLYIPGSFNCDNKGKLTVESIRTEYEHWIFNFIKENNLEENIVFLGKLDRTQMCQHILKSNIFVNPSCMEVHALSLREAMTVGIPCISSLCGSVIEYVNHEENGLIYRYEEYEILAFYINKLLSDTDYAKKLAANARNHMLNIKANGKNNLFKIYNNIVYDVNL